MVSPKFCFVFDSAEHAAIPEWDKDTVEYIVDTE